MNAQSEDLQEMSALIGKDGDKIEGLGEITEVFGNRWSALLQNWIPVLSDHISSISKLTTDVTELQSLAKIPDPYDILNSFNPRSKVTSTRTKSFASNEHVNKLKNDIQDLTTKLTLMDTAMNACQDDLVELQQNAQDNNGNASHSSSSHHPSHNTKGATFGAQGVSYKQYYFPNEATLQGWMVSNMSHPSHGLFVDIVSFSEFFGGDRYV